MPAACLGYSALADGPSTIHYREWGHAAPLVFLHGGWGYEVYPLAAEWGDKDGIRVLAPDRTGYGRSTRPARFDTAFHRHAAEETIAFLDALGVERCVLWGHSDGAVIAALVGLAAPARCDALVLEAFHFHRGKPASRDFFEAAATRPECFGASLAATMARAHGEPYWRALVEAHAKAWLAMAPLGGDLYDGRLGELRAPALFVHGSGDPRTEPGEIEAARAALPSAGFRIIAGGAHCPHSEPAVAEECNRAVRRFLGKVAPRLPRRRPE